MQRSIFLARLIGPVFIVMGIGLLFNGPTYRTLADEFLRSYALIYLSGILTIVAGLALVNVHNVWDGSWRLIITVLGWLGVVGGAFRMMLPQEIAIIGGTALVEPGFLVVAGILVMVLGAVLAYVGYDVSTLLASLGPKTSSTPRRARARIVGARRK
jgi:hypothetical protein